MNSEIKLGRMNTLKVNRKTANGLYLQALDGDEVLLPRAYETEDMQLDTTLKVFVYNDSEDRYVATTQTPMAKLDEFGYFEVVDTTDFGAFVDWGLPKDLFVPKKFQRVPLKKGMKFVFRVCLDEKSDRLIAVHKYNDYLKKELYGLEKNQRVDLIVREKTPLGYKVIVENSYEGMLFENEIFQDISIGDKLQGYVKNIRPDKKLDISLQPIGKESEELAELKIKEVLSNAKAPLHVSSKSDPELISQTFGLSKKNFKKALNSLIQSGQIIVDDQGIRLQ